MADDITFDQALAEGDEVLSRRAQLLNIDREMPPILHHDKSIKVKFDALIKAFK